MIAKHVAMKSVKKSDFAGLVKYITDEQEKNERVGFVSVTNCQSDRPDAAVLEIINTQSLNTRAESDKTFHLIVSFPSGEQPNDVILKEIEAKICDGLGYADHQRVSVVHHDTDNLHMHIAVNKIHPTRYTIYDPYYSHKVLGQLCEKLEQEYGLTQVNHKANKVGSENRALDMEHHAGVESLLSWIKRECLDQIQAATSWPELHQVMQDNGLSIKERGNGLVIVNQDGLMVKASSVARELSKGKLEDKLGVFVPSTSSDRPENADSPKKKYEVRPVRTRIDTTLLFARYKNEQQGVSANRTKEWKMARDQKSRQIEEAKRSAKLKRAATKILGQSKDEKKLLYSLASKGLRDEITRINERYQRDREKIFIKYQPQQWADWLRRKATEGDKEALEALRAREVSQKLKGNSVGAGGGQRVKSGINADLDSVTKKGTIIYKVDASAIRDDGDKLRVSRDATKDGLDAAIRMAMERYGNRITVNGTIEFKAKIIHAAVAANLSITFADDTLERHRQALIAKRNQQPEFKHESNDRGRSVGSVIGATGSATAGAGGQAASTSNAREHSGVNRFGKPNVSRPGTEPPPECRNNLRDLSDVPVVRLDSGSAVLLPGNVSYHMEQQVAKSDDTLRRNIVGAKLNVAAIDAVNKYIKEREKKRLSGFDILSHKLYNEDQAGVAAFSGIRKIDGQAMALLQQNDEIFVMPLDEAGERKLKRLAIGDQVTIVKNGVIKTAKGQSR
jgi:hypothetical protein